MLFQNLSKIENVIRKKTYSECLKRPSGESTRNKCSKSHQPLKAVETCSYNHRKRILNISIMD